MSASKPKFWVIGTAVLTVLLVIAAYFLLIGPKRAEAADFRQQTEDTKASNAQLEAKIEQLKVQFAELPQRQAELAAIKQAMPEEAALPTLVRDLDAMASGAGVTLMSLAPGEPTTIGPPAGAAAPAPAADPAAEGSESEDGATPAPTAAPAPSDLLASIPVSIVVVGDFYESELFLKNLQTDMPRAYLVTNLTVQAEKEADESGGKPATKNGDVTMTIAGSVFVLKPAASVTAPAAGAAGTPAPTPAPTATAAPTAGATTAPAPGATSAPTAGATATTEPSATATP